MSSGVIDTGTDHLLANLTGGILTLTFNRPEARNALSSELLQALGSQLADGEINPEVRCVVITGTGAAFCAGGDVKAMSETNSNGAKSTLDTLIQRQRLNQRATSGRLYKMPKPTLAVLPGPAAGAGLSIALACDLRIMSSTAFMTTAFAKVGFAGDYGGSLFMSQLVGTAKARELYFLSDRISAKEAEDLGLTNWVVEPEALQESAAGIAQKLANGPTVAYSYMKENLARALTSADVHDCLDLEASHHIHCGGTDDHKNAVEAFIEKRAPVFEGR
ncbi:enoyl-CoA hydratase [Candidatus Paraluminiphilus aquimaris]|uniref:Enoyl-CoA hydratase n=1 Tax=Candidatus Paraluminiphilus aquimaris TaxID=2518994 RepID=A0ABY6Q5C5_9GAMM|nr:enoyl-CoA hydratase [Candidatus Paraluminiphilus aquimaris]UZP73471.1 enoyl-CoA hydratase [Candidatus Paraluminiphilus aquimaris]